jgi:hypothetical protein
MVISAFIGNTNNIKHNLLELQFVIDAMSRVTLRENVQMNMTVTGTLVARDHKKRGNNILMKCGKKNTKREK